MRLRSIGVIVSMSAIASGSALADTYAAAVLPVMAPDLLESQKRHIDERVRAVAATSGVALQPAAETADSIEKAKKVGAACNLESLACQAQMGVLLGTKQVIVAHVTSDWAGDRLELRLLDALRGSTIREAAQRLPKDAPELRNRVIDGVALSVLAPKKTGALTIAAGDGTVLLDGVQLPDPAKGRIEGLAPGPHDVELRAEGQPVKHEVVQVKSGETASIDLGGAKVANNSNNANNANANNGNANNNGNDAKEPGVGLWLAGGGAAVAAAAGVGAGGLALALETTAMERDTRGALRSTGIGLLVATGVGVVVAGAGGVLMAVQAP